MIPLYRVAQNLVPIPQETTYVNLEARLGIGIVRRPLPGVIVPYNMMVAADAEGGE